MKRYLPFLIIAVVLVAAVVGGVIFWSRSSSEQASTAGAKIDAPPAASGPQPAASVPRGPAKPGAQPPHIRGAANAQVTLEEFGDFQCPPCGRFAPEIKKIEHDYGSRLRVIFRHMPLPQIHKHAMAAAFAAEAAGRQGRFWEMHDMLYENQKTWDRAADARPLFTSYAQKLGLDVARFTSDLNSPAVQSRVIEDIARANSLGVSGTPTIFLNGRELPGSTTLESLRAEVQKALAENK